VEHHQWLHVNLYVTFTCLNLVKSVMKRVWISSTWHTWHKTKLL